MTIPYAHREAAADSLSYFGSRSLASLAVLIASVVLLVKTKRHN
jgi:hypothetical protein